jgi:hypothetical protein
MKTFKEFINESINVWHGTPHKFDKFSTDFMNKGMKSQAYGWGLYFTDKKEIAEYYAKINSRNNLKQQYKGKDIPPNTPIEMAANIINNIRYNTISKAIERAKNLKTHVTDHEDLTQFWNNVIDCLENSKKTDFKNVPSKVLYNITIHDGKSPEEYDYLRWDKPITDEQLKKIITQLNKENYKGRIKIKNDKLVKVWGGEDDIITGKNFYEALAGDYNFSPKAASLFLLRAGIDGIKYPTGYQTKKIYDNTFDYVVFDDKNIKIENVEEL